MKNNQTSKHNNELLEPQNALPAVTIEELSDTQKAAVKRAGWVKLSPVQTRAIPYIQAKRDLMVQARTGSGKTGAFILPILDRVDPNKNNCQVLVLVPTRELARQVTEEAKLIIENSGIRTIAVYGGTSYEPQIKAFKNGAHLVVGTPGRVLDHLIKRNLLLRNLQILVYDEADRMMSMGFYPDMVQIQKYLPQHPINGYMFSATISVHVMRLANQFLNNPGFLSLSRDTVHVEDTEHVYYLTPGMDKDRALVRILEFETPNQAIVFCNTKARVEYVTAVLQRFGYNSDQISSDLTQNAREKVIKRFRDGKLRFLIATDVAARGIDIPDLSHVIQYEPSDDLESYIHRAGRTGRAGATGTAITLINHNEKRQLSRIAAHYNIKIEERLLPRNEDVENLVSQRLIGQLEARLRMRDRLQIERMRRFDPMAKNLAKDEDGLALLSMLLDDTYHSWMYKPPELPPIGSQEKTDKRSRKKSKPRRRKRSTR